MNSAAKNFYDETFCYVQSQIILNTMTKYLDPPPPKKKKRKKKKVTRKKTKKKKFRKKSDQKWGKMVKNPFSYLGILV